MKNSTEVATAVVTALMALPSAVSVAHAESADAPSPVETANYDDDGMDPVTIASIAQSLGVSPEEARARYERQDELVAIGERASRTLPDQVGGFWIDHERGGELVIAAVGDSEARVREAANPPPHLEHLVRVQPNSRHSFPVLRRMYDAMGRRKAAMAARVGAGVGITLDVPRNRLVLATSGDMDQLRAAAADAARSENVPADSLLFEHEAEGEGEGACINRYDCDAPARGGIEMSNTRTGGWCTSGFVVTSNTYSDRHYLLTAGHCGIVNDGMEQSFPAVDRYWGNIFAVIDDTKVDAARVGLDTSYWTFDNGVYRYQASPNFPISSASAATSTSVGVIVCKAARAPGDTEGYECDPVSAQYVNPSYGNNHDVFRIDNMCMYGGDSGGPIFTTDNSRARGLVLGGYTDLDCSGSERVDATHIEFALYHLNVHIATI